jgi:hypothetical protein
MAMISPDGKRSAQDHPVEDLLAAHADALLAERDDFAPRFDQYGIAPSQAAEVTELLHLAQQLRDSLTPVALSEEFVSRLKSELVGEQPVTLLVRWRKLPPHYQLAAKLGGLTIGAGLVLLATRRALDVLDALRRRNQPEADKGLSLTAS